MSPEERVVRDWIYANNPHVIAIDKWGPHKVMSTATQTAARSGGAKIGYSPVAIVRVMYRVKDEDIAIVQNFRTVHIPTARDQQDDLFIVQNGQIVFSYPNVKATSAE